MSISWFKLGEFGSQGPFLRFQDVIEESLFAELKAAVHEHNLAVMPGHRFGPQLFLVGVHFEIEAIQCALYGYKVFIMVYSRKTRHGLQHVNLQKPQKLCEANFFFW